MNLWRRLISTRAPRSVVLIRILVGGVFVAEGVQKFLYPNEVGAGRFAKIGIPNPEVMGPFVGVVEIVCGALTNKEVVLAFHIVDDGLVDGIASDAY